MQMQLCLAHPLALQSEAIDVDQGQLLHTFELQLRRRTAATRHFTRIR